MDDLSAYSADSIPVLPMSPGKYTGSYRPEFPDTPTTLQGWTGRPEHAVTRTPVAEFDDL